jgi:hypothetical protein
MFVARARESSRYTVARARNNFRLDSVRNLQNFWRRRKKIEKLKGRLARAVVQTSEGGKKLNARKTGG